MSENTTATGLDGLDQKKATRHAAIASHLADTDRATITLDDAQRRTLVAACINALPIAPGDAKLTDLISILSGTDTTVVVHRSPLMLTVTQITLEKPRSFT